MTSEGFWWWGYFSGWFAALLSEIIVSRLYYMNLRERAKAGKP